MAYLSEKSDFKSQKKVTPKYSKVTPKYSKVTPKYSQSHPQIFQNFKNFGLTGASLYIWFPLVWAVLSSARSPNKTFLTFKKSPSNIPPFRISHRTIRKFIILRKWVTPFLNFSRLPHPTQVKRSLICSARCAVRYGVTLFTPFLAFSARNVEAAVCAKR